ncbi:MAG: hypothetical protein HQM00_10520 [Magnetococcales bacterium]|nr:hypothetical protein [Magnetococcales bacterium]
MKNRLRGLFVGLVLGSMMAVGWSLRETGVSSVAPQTRPAFHSSLPANVLMQGISYTHSQNNRVKINLKADSLQLESLFVGFMPVPGVGELLLKNGILSICLPDRESTGSQESVTLDLETLTILSNVEVEGSVHALQKTRQIRGRRITKFNLAEWTLRVYRNREQVLKFYAPKGRILDQKRASFVNAMLEQSQEERRIYAHEILWDDAQQRFVIPGPYLLETPLGTEQGQGLRVGLDFSLASGAGVPLNGQ